MRRLGAIGARTLAWFLGSTFVAAVIGLTIALVAGVGGGLDPSVRDAVTAAIRGSGGRGFGEHFGGAQPEADADQHRPGESHRRGRAG